MFHLTEREREKERDWERRCKHTHNERIRQRQLNCQKKVRELENREKSQGKPLLRRRLYSVSLLRSITLSSRLRNLKKKKEGKGSMSFTARQRAGWMQWERLLRAQRKSEVWHSRKRLSTRRKRRTELFFLLTFFLFIFLFVCVPCLCVCVCVCIDVDVVAAHSCTSRQSLFYSSFCVCVCT